MSVDRPKGAGGSKKSDLKIRFLSAVVMAPAVLVIAWFGGLAFSLLALIGILLFMKEWFALTGTRDTSKRAYAGYAVLIAIAAAFDLGYPGMSLLVAVFGAGLAYLLGGADRTARWAAEGVLYSGLALYGLLGARSGDNGQLFLFFLLIVVWATDIGAYFTGRTLGGPKLWRQVSPNKTWSGATGGLVAANLFGVGFVAMFGHVNVWWWVVLASVFSVVSQLGDLMESAIKRRFDVKDSSGLIPGHGGVMDRVDGLVAAAITAAALGLVLGGTLGDPMSGLFWN
ncbi:phosphatidate cytidylyltransferase [Roseibium sp. RKSG952]|uniref:phosphatidate cytidylyltransferase n=1 Tax=Roseibium sp. RKSG952 TaxID=2529384 RepID=UPI0012BD4A20|nr:phosphatidate cytidylyltransferase [Roseibium sp. RKSG952]MTH97875.1 phosphatidate cytidylyltransferase [Roseibium sp. RKSG952]